MKKIIAACAGALLLTGLTGCNTSKIAVDGLMGKWDVVSINGKKVNAGDASQSPYLAFDVANGQVAGYTGCNRLTGSFNTKLPAGVIDLSQLGSTRMMCADMSLEDNLLAAMATVKGYKGKGANQVVLTNAAGKDVIKLRKGVQDYSMATLLGKWTISELNGRKPADGATITFDKDSTYSCETGCNVVNGNYYTRYTSVLFGPGASTRMSCPDMWTEMTLISSLPGITKYSRLADGSYGFYNGANTLVMKLTR